MYGKRRRELLAVSKTRGRRETATSAACVLLCLLLSSDTRWTMTPCHSFVLQPSSDGRTSGCGTIDSNKCVGIRNNAKPLFGILKTVPEGRDSKFGNKFNMEEIEALEKELEWNDPQTRAIEFAQQRSSSASPQDLDDTDDFDGSSSSLDDDPSHYVRYVVPPSLHDARIDAILSALDPSLSRTRCSALVSEGVVEFSPPPTTTPPADHHHTHDTHEPLLKTVIARKSERLPANSTIYLRSDNPSSAFDDNDDQEVLPENLPLSILYEDEHLIVLNKAAGMVVHPGAGNRNGTVVNALAYYLQNHSPYGAGEFVGSHTSHDDDDSQNDQQFNLLRKTRPGIVHRLDKGTTGVLVVAKTRRALAGLAESFAQRTVKKTYLAVTVGNIAPKGEHVIIDEPIGRHPLHRQKMRVVPDPTANGTKRKHSSRSVPNKKQRLNTSVLRTKQLTPAQTGRRALSFVNTLATNNKLSVVKVRIATGRTHQIRVHLEHSRTPVYGDEVYGLTDWNRRLKKSRGINRPLLHARRLELVHPITGEEMVWEADMADDMVGVVEKIWPDWGSELE